LLSDAKVTLSLTGVINLAQFFTSSAKAQGAVGYPVDDVISVFAVTPTSGVER